MSSPFFRKKKKKRTKPPFSSSPIPFHSNFHPRPRCRGPKYLHWTNDQRVPAPDLEASSPVRGPKIPQESPKIWRNLMNFWSKRPQIQSHPVGFYMFLLTVDHVHPFSGGRGHLFGGSRCPYTCVYSIRSTHLQAIRRGKLAADCSTYMANVRCSNPQIMS